MNAWDWSIDGWIVLTGILSACSCSLLGNYLVLRRMSLMGDAISHAVLPGLAIAFILSGSRSAWPMFVGAVVVGALTTLLSETVRRYGKVEHGAAMGVVFSILFAAGLVLIRQAADHVDLDPGCVLYGNITQVALDAIGDGFPPTVRNLSIVFLANLLFVGAFYKELKISAFDPELATTLGIHATLMHYALMIMVAVTAVACFESVGSVLVIAMLIVPAATAHLLTDRMGLMIAVSLVIALLSAVLGHIGAMAGPGWVGISKHVSANTAAMMAVTAGLFLMLALFLAPTHGLISKRLNRIALALQIVREDILGLVYRWHELRPPDRPPMSTAAVFKAVGRGALSRWAMRSLRSRRLISCSGGSDHTTTVELTEQGLVRASRLVRSHRLWESYLAKHFRLPLDHLHMPAERMEHYISPTMGDKLEEQLTDVSLDPHGRKIPDKPDGA